MAQQVIDIGNTLIKLGVFDGQSLIWSERYSQVNDSEIQQLLTAYSITAVIVSTVKDIPQQSWLYSLSQQVRVLNFTRDMAFGIQNHYATPNTLGLDRLAGIMGARCLYPGQNSLVIDAGTCITYDGIDANGNYYGGSISPGLNMRYKALQHYTAVLPLVDVEVTFDNYYGHDTTTAIRSGVQNGIRYEVEGFIQAYNQQQHNIILTGGDSVFLDTVLKNSIFAGYIKTEPHLVLKGLNAAIQEHND